MTLFKPAVLSLTVLVGCAPSATETIENHIELCETTIRDYAPLRDGPNAQEYAELFTEDGTFVLGETVIEGRQALEARHKTANQSTRWSHRMTDIDITSLGNTLTARTGFIVKSGPRGSAPVVFNREITGHYADQLVIDSGQCKIKARYVNVVSDSPINAPVK
jgi:hypothetical protein